MNNTEWDTLFERRTRESWLSKIEADAKGAFSADQLQADLGEGIRMHAIQTREEIKGLPHLDPTSLYTSIPWKQRPGWAIGMPVMLEKDSSRTVDRIKQGIAWKAESFVIETDPNALLITENQVNALLSKWPDPAAYDIHFRLGAHLAHFVRSRWHASLSTTGSIQLQTIRPFANQSFLPALPSYEASIFDEAPLFKSVSAFVQPHESKEVNLLGGTLVALHSYLKYKENRAASLTSLLPRLQCVIESGSNFYAEVARLRALRYLLTRFVKETIPEWRDELDIPFLVEITLDSGQEGTLSNLLLHATTTAMAAVLGGCATLVIRPPSELPADQFNEALRLTLNLQHMLRHEAHLDKVVDPAAGSYYIEVLTDRFIQSAWTYYEHKR